MTKGCSTNSPNLILTENLWDVQSIKFQDSKIPGFKAANVYMPDITGNLEKF